MEGLLNYAYVQANSLNLFDQLGHALGITLVSAPGGNAPCGYQTGPTVPAAGGGTTTNPKNFAECAGILGDKQPGINYGTNPSGLFGHLGRYDPSVCPNGSEQLSICNPADPPHSAAGLQSATTAPTQPQQQAATPNKIKNETQKQLHDLLPQLPPLSQIPQLPPGVNLNSGSAPTGSTTQDLLNFLLGQ
jgi:hypothetical protein